MEESWLSDLEDEFGVTAVQPWRWPPLWLRGWAEALCGVLDAIPSIGHENGHWGWYRHGAWGCRLQLWRIWSVAPVIKTR